MKIILSADRELLEYYLQPEENESKMEAEETS